VQLGEADATVVYATDMRPTTQSQLTAFKIPAAFNADVAYPIAATRGDNASGGQAFVSYVLSPAGQQLRKTWNFLAALLICAVKNSATRRAAFGSGAEGEAPGAVTSTGSTARR